MADRPTEAPSEDCDSGDAARPDIVVVRMLEPNPFGFQHPPSADKTCRRTVILRSGKNSCQFVLALIWTVQAHLERSHDAANCNFE